jgi:hypothetical protein
MKEYRSIEATHNPRMLSRQDLKVYSRVRTSNPKDSGNGENKRGKGFQLTKECKLIEVMNNVTRQLRQESKSWNRVQMTDPKDSGTC